MRLRTPVTGAVIDVDESKAAKYLGQGFQAIEPPKPVKKTAQKKAAPKKQAPKKKAEPAPEPIEAGPVPEPGETTGAEG